MELEEEQFRKLCGYYRFEFENVLSSIIDDYLNTFNIEISQFSDYCMKGMKEDE